MLADKIRIGRSSPDDCHGKQKGSGGYPAIPFPLERSNEDRSKDGSGSYVRVVLDFL
jgi:hypothetical protein